MAQAVPCLNRTRAGYPRYPGCPRRVGAIAVEGVEGFTVEALREQTTEDKARRNR